MSALRRRNLEQIIRHLSTNEPAHRAQLARVLGVTRTSGSTLVAELLDKGVIAQQEAEATPDDVDGRAGARFALDDRLWTAGIETTLDTISVTLRKPSMVVVGTREERVDADSDWQARRDVALELVRELLTEHRADGGRLLAVGIGVPGQVAADGMVVSAMPNQPWSGVNVREVMERELEVPVLVDNNVRMEAFAESRWGAARGYSQVVYLHAASGIAVGLIIDGHLVRGARGAAGEFGHLSIDIEGAQCTCGNRGCLVLAAGRAAVERQLDRTWPERPSWDQLLRLAADGDRAASAAFADAGETIGRALAGLSNVFAPELVVIGGDMARAGEVFREAVERKVRALALSVRRDLHVVTSELGGTPAVGAAGAAAMVWSDTVTSSAIIDALLR